MKKKKNLKTSGSFHLELRMTKIQIFSIFQFQLFGCLFFFFQDVASIEDNIKENHLKWFSHVPMELKSISLRIEKIAK